MREQQASHTAQRSALRRAAHQLLDHPPVFADPLALALVGREAAAALRADPHHFASSRLEPSLRAFLAARSRRAEEELARAVAGGVGQYVILGAGLDSFALRNPHGAALRVFEVDHPATQALKKERLAEAGLAVPPWLRFVPVDFQVQALAGELAAAGHDPGRPSFFAWLGVTLYLTPEEILNTLGFIAQSPAGGGVVFDYAVAPELLDERGRRAFEAIAGRTAAAGEPWRGWFDPAALAKELDRLGFTQVEDLGQAEINQRYFAGRGDGLGVGRLSRLVTALVGKTG